MRVAAKRTGRSRRRVLLAAALGAGLFLPGCATKGDIRTLDTQLRDMQAHQDSVLRSIQVQNRLMLDTLRSSMAVAMDTRGQTSHRFEELGRLVEQTRLLVGENLEAMRALNTRLDALEAMLSAGRPAGGAAPVPGTDQTAEQLYQRGMDRLDEESHAAARLVFQSVVRQYPDHALAADAQYQLGEVYYAEGDYDDAYAAFETVASRWPTSVRAAEALFRAGVIAQERKDNARARRYYDTVIEQYAGTDAARAAAARRKDLPR